MTIWIAVFYAVVAGTPVSINDYDEPRFRSKRACYMHVIRTIPKVRQVILEHLPITREETHIWGECIPKGSERASN